MLTKLKMYTLKELEQAREFIKSRPAGWIKVLNRTGKFYWGEATLDNTQEMHKLGPVVAAILEQEYYYDAAKYFPASNSIMVKSSID